MLNSPSLDSVTVPYSRRRSHPSWPWFIWSRDDVFQICGRAHHGCVRCYRSSRCAYL